MTHEWWHNFRSWCSSFLDPCLEFAVEFPEAFCLTSHPPPRLTENASWHTLQFPMYLFSPTQKPETLIFILHYLWYFIFQNSFVWQWGLKRRQRPFLNQSFTPTTCQQRHKHTSPQMEWANWGQSFPPAFALVYTVARGDYLSINNNIKHCLPCSVLPLQATLKSALSINSQEELKSRMCVLSICIVVAG